MREYTHRCRKDQKEKKKKRKKSKFIFVAFLFLIVVVGVSSVLFRKLFQKEKPETIIKEYMDHIEKQEYEEMYAMIDDSKSGSISKEQFIERNTKIYEGIEIKNLKLENIAVTEKKKDTILVSYKESFETIGGLVDFENQACFVDTKDGYKLSWTDSLIFPTMEESDKVQITTIPAERGLITDRKGKILAGKGIGSSVGIIPGKIENKIETLQMLAGLLGVEVYSIEKKMNANWVKEDSFVPIITIPKITELDLMQLDRKEEIVKEQERQEKLLAIPGVMFSDIQIRSYELGAAAAHLVGYVQSVTAEDLKKHQGEGYSSTSVIGKSGMEGRYEKELKGQDGHEIKIVNKNGITKETVASIIKQDGANIQLTIDANLQTSLYEQFKEDKGCSVAMNPYTGEVLALVSTPSYDNNDFIKGMSTEQWTALNDNKDQPLYNRYRQIWCPGSTFKPIIAAIGLETGSLDPNEDFGNVGSSWQKDESWGSYYVTTLHEYEPVTMKNAIIYSDNIYFAKAALKIGLDNMMNLLNKIGFNQELPFEIMISSSQYSNTEKIETEIQLADSGYGQGQVLVNPLHMASIYTAFLNYGNIIKPYLRYNESATPQIWVPQVFSTDSVKTIMEGMIGVVNDLDGTAYSAHREDITLAGKTGTAEIKASKEDTTGTEIGWFSVFTADREAMKPVLVISMVENVKGIGGSGYVTNKDAEVLDTYFSNEVQ
ncbi:penicillin-binding transpeptidase domain-containing protein [Lachnospiraceae bacterium LCP25S3_G4]